MIHISDNAELAYDRIPAVSVGAAVSMAGGTRINGIAILLRSFQHLDGLCNSFCIRARRWEHVCHREIIIEVLYPGGWHYRSTDVIPHLRSMETAEWPWNE